MSTSGMHRRPFEGRHLVSMVFHSVPHTLQWANQILEKMKSKGDFIV